MKDRYTFADEALDDVRNNPINYEEEFIKITKMPLHTKEEAEIECAALDKKQEKLHDLTGYDGYDDCEYYDEFSNLWSAIRSLFLKWS